MAAVQISGTEGYAREADELIERYAGVTWTRLAFVKAAAAAAKRVHPS
jgi:hypothetical protein